jgi:thiamine biosynthesis lipoprotein
MMLRRSFHAMGTDVELLLDAPAGERAERALDRAEAELERLEQVLSRFRSDSELSRLNRDGHVAEASADLVRVVELALAGREATGGRFDPTVHDALVAAGYDRTFDEVPAEAPGVPSTPVTCGGAVRIDGLAIVLSPGTRLDLGGIGKGYAVDRVAESLAVAGPCLVNAGGDLAVRGGSWPVGVADGLTLELSRGGMATSGRDRRRWVRGGEELHHLIDPSSGRPAESDLVRVTVVADSASDAEVLAKAAFLGADVDAPRVLVSADGRVVLAGGLA